MRTMTLSRGSMAILIGFFLLPACPVFGKATYFKRGDSNSDGALDISDPIHSLEFLFLGTAEVTCMDAADSNDEGGLDLSDAIYSLEFLFIGGPFPPHPGPFLCGRDLSRDPLSCSSYPLCPQPEPGPITELPGPSTDLANDHIPDIIFPALDEADYVIMDSLAVSFREFLLVFKDATTVEEANQLLASNRAAITGAVSSVGLLLIEVPLQNLGEMMTLLGELNQDPVVLYALPEMGGTPETLPPHNVTPNLWTWELGTPPTNGNWGLKMIRAPQLWNLDTFVRRNRLTDRVSAGVVDAGFTDGFMDMSGFSTHPDLEDLLIIEGGPGGISPDDHGTMVAGIIGGARWDNNLGLEGINPWLDRILARAAVFSVFNHTATWGRQIENIITLLRDFPDIKAINNSYGLSNTYTILADILDNGMLDGSYNLNPVTVQFGDLNGDNDHMDPLEFPGFDANGDGTVDETWAQVVSHYGDLYNDLVTRFVTSPGGRGDFFVVASAGNAGPPYQAVDNSPIANAASRHGGRFLSVESINWNNTASNFSDVGGSVSAPGECVRSTEASEAPATANLDDANGDGIADCLAGNAMGWWDGLGSGNARDDDLATHSGTSFAAPLATGLITALWKLEPSLTVEDIRRLLLDADFNANTLTVGTQPRIDAFAAAMGIDTLRYNDPRNRENYKRLQRALVSVDDGTLDGNLRARASPSEEDPDGVHTLDRRRGDGVVNMRDFRAFRDAYLQALVANGLVPAASVKLDGDERHFKRDLNFDGCRAFVGGRGTVPAHPVDVPARTDIECDNVPGDEVYSRYDFNGDGSIHEWFATAPFKMDPDGPAGGCQANRDFRLEIGPGCLRDLDVLADPHLWVLDVENVATLPGDDVLPSPSDPPPEWNLTRLFLDRDGDDKIDYLHSFDVHLRILDNADLISINQDPLGKIRQGPWPLGERPGVVTFPVLDIMRHKTVWYKRTVPHGSGTEKKEVFVLVLPLFGEDLFIEIDWGTLTAKSTSRGIAPELFPRASQKMSWHLEPKVAEPGEGENFHLIDRVGDCSTIEEELREWARTFLLPKSHLAIWLGVGSVDIKYISYVSKVYFDSKGIKHCKAHLDGVVFIGK